MTEVWTGSWHASLVQNITGSLRNPHLMFTRKDRSWYDLDNLACAVLAVSGGAFCESLWAEVERGPNEGVLIREEEPPTPPRAPTVVSLHIGNPSRFSIANRPVPPELADVEPFGADEDVGLSLAFEDADVAVGNLSFDGPVKSLVDDLTPLLGDRRISGRLHAKDYRVRELRVTRGHGSGRGGVTVTLWQLPLDPR